MQVTTQMKYNEIRYIFTYVCVYLVGVVGQVVERGTQAALWRQYAGVMDEFLRQRWAPNAHLAVTQTLDRLAQDHHLLHQVL